jgi:hypothetical protein
MQLENGRWVIGKGTTGCRHCGTIETHTAKNGKAIWYHPGVGCCRKALEDQLSWRKRDLENQRNAYRQAQNLADDLEAKASRAIGAERATLNSEANKARAALPLKEKRLRLIVDGDPSNEVLGLKAEIAELEQQLRKWRGE